MTRDEFMSALRTADDKFDTEPLSWWAQCIAEHDADQRAEIERLTTELEQLK